MIIIDHPFSFSKHIKRVLFITFVMLCCSITVHAQGILRITLAQSIVEAEALNFNELAVQATDDARIDPLFWFELNNPTNERVRDLFIRIQLSSTNNGELVDLLQVGFGLQLEPQQRINATSLEVIDGFIPGIPSEIHFEGSLDDILSDEGLDLYNNSGGLLPNDVYTITVSLVKDRDINQVWATDTKFLGSRPQENVVDFQLLQPGDVVGSEATSMSTFPNFRWEGQASGLYRLIVVQEVPGESAESLIQTSFSTPATLKNGSSTNGSLLTFEMVDAELNGTSFTIPPQGTQQLAEGNKYFWQLFSIVRSQSGTEIRPSTIWEFTIPAASSGAGGGVTTTPDLGVGGTEETTEETEPETTVVQSTGTLSEEEVQQLLGQLTSVIDLPGLQELIEANYQIDAIEIGGTRYEGNSMKQAVEQFIQQVQSGKVKF